MRDSYKKDLESDPDWVQHADAYSRTVIDEIASGTTHDKMVQAYLDARIAAQKPVTKRKK
jgi:hypothetical protein